MKGVTEDHVEQATLEWLAALGWEVGHGPDVSPPDAKTPGTERDTYREVALRHRLRDAIGRLNPHILVCAQDEACRMVLNPNIPGQVQANRQMHRWLVEGVPVQYQKDGETRGTESSWWTGRTRRATTGSTLNQFSIPGSEAHPAPGRSAVPQRPAGRGGRAQEPRRRRTPTCGPPSTSCRPTRKTFPTCSRATPCWSSATASRRGWARSRPTRNASWPGAPSTV